MIYFVKYFVFIIFIAFLIYETVNIYKIIEVNNNDRLLEAKVVNVTKKSGYVSAEIYLNVILAAENKSLNVKGNFRNSLRWWLQKVPNNNDRIFFYIDQKDFSTLDNQSVSVYGISINEPCSTSKKVYDLLYAYVFSKSIFLFILILILVLIGISFKDGNQSFNINYYPLIYLLFRFVVSGIIL